MTVMLAREVRINFILSIALAVLGVLMRLGGILALKNNWFLPEYATVAKGCGGALILFGLVWFGLTAIKRAMLPAQKAAR